MNVLWQAKVPDEAWEMLEDKDCDELCNNLDAFWEELLEKKIRMKIIDRAIAETRG